MKTFLHTKQFFFASIFLMLPLSLSASSHKVLPHPLGNKENAYLYTFIGSYLEEFFEYKKRMPNRLTATEFFNQEKESLRDDPTRKMHIDNMMEGEMAELLKVMLLQNKAYIMVTLYDRDGVGLTSSVKKAHTYNSFKGRPEAMKFGFLTPNILMGSKIYTYKNNCESFKEYILTLYKYNNVYFTSQDYYMKDNFKENYIIGYMSYIVNVPNSSKDDQK